MTEQIRTIQRFRHYIKVRDFNQVELAKQSIKETAMRQFFKLPDKLGMDFDPEINMYVINGLIETDGMEIIVP